MPLLLSARPRLFVGIIAVVMTVLGAGGGHALQRAAAPVAACVDLKDDPTETRGDSSVDGKELLWEDDSGYNDALRWAVAKWYQKTGPLSTERRSWPLWPATALSFPVRAPDHLVPTRPYSGA
ncbi:hypothetical protein SSPIM334S_07941 [Streptomyces spiroverticillatus]